MMQTSDVEPLMEAILLTEATVMDRAKLEVLRRLVRLPRPGLERTLVSRRGLDERKYKRPIHAVPHYCFDIARVTSPPRVLL